MIVIAHCLLALLLFFLINWIGRHAIDFGYGSTTLFDEPNDAVALNFFLRVLTPTVFIIGLSAAMVSIGYPSARYGIVRVVPIYYALRVVVILLLNRHRLVNWYKIAVYALTGIALAEIAYEKLILPNRSLMPNLDSMGNELWLAIFAFLYAVANKIMLPSGPGARRRNRFIWIHYRDAVAHYGAVVEGKIADPVLRLITYAVIIYEDYARPPAIRMIERWLWWKPVRSTGIMQVAAASALSDFQSVDLGTTKLLAAWNDPANAVLEPWQRVRATIADYNRDDDYIVRVEEVMASIAKRGDPRFRPVYEAVYE